MAFLFMLGRVLAIDYGERRVGLAISDPMRIIATALTTLVVKREADVMGRIVDIVHQQEITEIIVGLPLSLDGSDNARSIRVRELARALDEALGIPVSLADERFTTAAAKRLLPQIEDKKSRRGKEKLDQIAAVIILQDFLRARST